MKRKLFYTLIIVLYLLIPLSVLGIVGTMVSHKYEVDHSRTVIDINKSLNESEKADLHKGVDLLEQELNRQKSVWKAILLIGCILPTGILIIRAITRKNIHT